MYRAVHRGAALLAAAVLGLAATQTPAFAQGTYPVTEGTLTTNSATDVIPEGGALTIFGSGFAPGTLVTITAASTITILDTVRADATGHITDTIRLNLPPGRHTITATGADATGGTLELIVIVTITGTTGALTLAQTGTDSGDLVAVGGATAAAGAALLLIARRRRSRSAAV
jgi:LPXTG-motif cell wall-anchored protein